MIKCSDPLFINRNFSGTKILYKRLMGDGSRIAEWIPLANVNDITFAGINTVESATAEMNRSNVIIWLADDEEGATWLSLEDIEQFENENLNILYGKNLNGT